MAIMNIIKFEKSENLGEMNYDDIESLSFTKTDELNFDEYEKDVVTTSSSFSSVWFESPREEKSLEWDENMVFETYNNESFDKFKELITKMKPPVFRMHLWKSKRFCYVSAQYRAYIRSTGKFYL